CQVGEGVGPYLRAALLGSWLVGPPARCKDSARSSRTDRPPRLSSPAARAFLEPRSLDREPDAERVRGPVGRTPSPPYPGRQTHLSEPGHGGRTCTRSAWWERSRGGRVRWG